MRQPALIAAVAAFGAACALPAGAQTGSGPPGTPMPRPQPPTTVAPGDRADPEARPDAPALTPDRLREQLAQAGFREVRILDAAYLVQARTPDGQVVVMMVNPPTATPGLPGGVGGAPLPGKPPPLTGPPAEPRPDSGGGGGGLETPLPGTGPERRTDNVPLAPPDGTPGPSGGRAGGAIR